MTDKTKTCLSVLFFVSMFVLPVVGLAVGWIGWDLRTGALVALAIFAVFFLSAGILLATVKELAWIPVGLPFLFGLLYAVLPDFIPGPVDDAAVFAAGALLTFGLWIKKQPDAPRWIVFPLLLSGLYTLIGDLIPGPVDEFLVAAIGLGTATITELKQHASGRLSLPKDEADQGKE